MLGWQLKLMFDRLHFIYYDDPQMQIEFIVSIYGERNGSPCLLAKVGLFGQGCPLLIFCLSHS